MSKKPKNFFDSLTLTSDYHANRGAAVLMAGIAHHLFDHFVKKKPVRLAFVTRDEKTLRFDIRCWCGEMLLPEGKEPPGGKLYCANCRKEIEVRIYASKEKETH